MRNTILCGDVLAQLATLPDESVHMVCTSPPYWGLRSYGTETWEGGEAEHVHRDRDVRAGAPGSAKQASSAGSNYVTAGDCECGAIRQDKQLGLEPTPELYVEHMVAVFREVRRVLRKDGVLFLNIGDSYAGSGKGPSNSLSQAVWDSQPDRNQGQTRAGAPTDWIQAPLGLKPKDLVGIPWRVAFALQADGWWLRSEITWCKTAPMPESVRDRPTSATEKIFLLSKSERYYYDQEAIRTPFIAAERDQAAARKARALSSHKSMPTGERNGIRPKQDQVGSRRNDGFNGRWDEAEANDALPSGRNALNYWLLNPEPFPEAHFATFPTELAKRCILAGSSERGVCSECGAPWRRVTDKIDANNRLGSAYREHDERDLTQGHPSVPSGKGAPERVLVGWQPTCKHEAPTERAIVLDPFMGAGTTALVALQAGRDFVGIELNPAYVAMAEKRIAPYRWRLL